DILSERNDGSVRYIEVKGRALSGAVILTENELQRLRQLETRSWLYVVTHCASGEPKLTCINNPASVLKTEEIFRQVQYLVPEREWKNAGERIS
ncbi:MAG: DUF3883 domain-containing protein, partial [Ignavibacteriae bacterium]|nr:DUF3883 domain-containing protein [Ignavibacteriota bacterium]